MCVHVYSGITSRCISLAEAYYLAKENNMHNLIIIWQLEKWCNIKYQDVFEKDQFQDIHLTVMNYKFFPADWGEGVKEYLRKGQISKVLYCLKQWVLYFARKIYNYRAERLMDYFKERDTYVRYDPETEIGWSGKAYVEWLMSCWKRVQGYLQDKVNFCAGIYCGLIKEEIEKSADLSVLAFRDRFYKIVDTLVPEGGGTWIGVHVRRTDHKASIRESTLDSFIHKMNEAIADYETARFFLATDDRDVEEELKKAFPGRIVTYSDKTWGRNSKSGMESAIIDCLCLSRCNYILGSFCSVFSKFAAGYGNTELIICRK